MSDRFVRTRGLRSQLSICEQHTQHTQHTQYNQNDPHHHTRNPDYQPPWSRTIGLSRTLTPERRCRLCFSLPACEHAAITGVNDEDGFTGRHDYRVTVGKQCALPHHRDPSAEIGPADGVAGERGGASGDCTFVRCCRGYRFGRFEHCRQH